jgi:hypothetical protein
MSLQGRDRHAKRHKADSGLPILPPCGCKTEQKHSFSAAGRTITRQQEGGKGFMTSGEKNLTLSEASNCLRVPTLTCRRLYGGHNGSAARIRGPGGIRMRECRTRGSVLHTWASPDDLPEKQESIGGRPVTAGAPGCQAGSRSHGSRVGTQQAQGWPKRLRRQPSGYG